MSEVWYAAYGSNLAADRFAHYLGGGRPKHAARTYPGARDRTPPTRSEPVRLTGELFFGWRSPTWGGGVAFLDEESAGSAYGRAYRITREQLADVVAQEMHREPGDLLDLDRLVGRGRLVLGDGRYDTLLVVGDLDGEPVLTFTCPAGAARPSTNAPAPAYLALLARGLHEAHSLTAPQIADYLGGCAGVRPEWTEPRLREAVAAALRT